MPTPATLLMLGAVALAACQGPPASGTGPAPVPTQAPPPPAVPEPAPPGPTRDPALLALLWTQRAAEYHALCLQTFQAARGMLDAALADPRWTAVPEQAGRDVAALPPAVIVDVDETVLDNSPFNARCLLAGQPFAAAAWTRWVQEAQAAPLPGALEFLAAAAAKGVTVFYLTNRSREHEAATRSNLARAGMPLLDQAGIDVVLCRNEVDAEADKTGRRARVAATHRVLLVCGDDLNDFVSGVRPTQAAGRHPPASRRHEGERLAAARLARTSEAAAWWGTRWFMLPNPVYGSWLETARACALPADAAATADLASQLVTGSTAAPARDTVPAAGR
jgi:acid phosphatase